MKLFWKVFLLLLMTLVSTAILSGWLSQKWLAENQQIEKQLATLIAMGETAAGLYHEGGMRAYRQWHHHMMRGQQMHGALLDAEGDSLHRRPLPPELQELARQAVSGHQRIKMIDPPRLAVAMPLSYQSQQYYWVAAMRMPPQSMRQSGRQAVMMRLAIALLSIILISWVLTRMFTRPIRSLQQTTEQLGTGALESRTETAVSSRKDELGELADSIDQMAAQLQSLVSSHKQLLRDISHELRSPLARLQVALELARNEAGDSAAQELNRIEKEANRLNELIGEVLTLARMEQGAVELQKQPLQLDAIIDEVTDDARFEAEAAQKRILIKEKSACRISGDALWIGRALDNVVRNAVRHTPAGEAVEISLNSSGQQITVIIRDFGDGAEEAMLEKLFEPFVRGSEARERHAGGSGYGLGLAIAKHAVQLHHGDIHASNHKDGGLIITITLPSLKCS